MTTNPHQFRASKVALITGITGQDGSYLAEFLLEKGAIDMVVDRRELQRELAELLALLTRQPAEAVSRHP